jgi:hypothetical protein
MGRDFVLCLKEVQELRVGFAWAATAISDGFGEIARIVCKENRGLSLRYCGSVRWSRTHTQQCKKVTQNACFLRARPIVCFARGCAAIVSRRPKHLDPGFCRG